MGGNAELFSPRVAFLVGVYQVISDLRCVIKIILSLSPGLEITSKRGGRGREGALPWVVWTCVCADAVPMAFIYQDARERESVCVHGGGPSLESNISFFKDVHLLSFKIM